MMHSVPLELSAPRDLSAQAVMRRADGESFPVAMRVLSREDREHLLAVYGFARLADELGDEYAGDRLVALDWLEQEVEHAYAGAARHPLLVRLQSTISQCGLPRDPLLRLIEANRMDQRLSRYQTWGQLRSYCQLSATPVGHLVLRVFGLATAERIAQSDDVCTALQLAEHLQDLGEDLRRGRIYLPEEDLVRFGSSHEQLAALVSRGGDGLGLGGDLGDSPAHSLGELGSAGRLRETIRFETGRARELLTRGVPLVGGIPGRPKLAVAGFVAGARAALDGIELMHFDVLAGVRRPSRSRLLWALVSVLAESHA